MVITKPLSLQFTSSNIQVRRSTRTTDRRKAEAALPAIASAIYQEFDSELNNQRSQVKPITFKYLSEEEVQNDPILSDPFIARRMLPPLEKPKDPSTRLSRFIPVYVDYLKANQIGDHKERRTKRSRCEQFMSVVGDLHVEDIKKFHAYKYADWLNDQGLANKTIKSAVSRISMLLVRAEQMGIIDNNPVHNVVLANYGRPAKSYLVAREFR